MNSDSIWQPNTGLQWLQALALPAQPWVKPFLKPMKFPPALASDPQIFQAIHTKAVEKRAALWEANKELGYLPELDTAITREFVTEALEHLEAKVDSSAVEAFKDWAYRNFIHNELTGALLAWRVVLRHACGQGNPAYTSVLPPQNLLPLLPKIADLVSYERDQETHDELRRLSPPYKDEEGLGLDISPQAMTVEEIVRNESTRAALQCIVDALSESEREEILAWAKAQGTEQQVPASLLLGAMPLD
ncbi:hypothetical protein [Nostoc sp. WHI]|uniref:hypothetical protein n=1 Tax=Nostoc sp. WHI TaxID=2650611 RepID=UPI0018C53AE4|nr:hypothetical protein [Nostoc sp. WHI]MBG1271392.1 hypothetical protein [Nostoc sp. WHI]